MTERWDDWTLALAKPTTWCGCDWPQIAESYVVLPQAQPRPHADASLVLNELVAAIDAGKVRIDGPIITGRGDPEIGYEHWEWADEWLHYARRALALASTQREAI